MRVHYLIRPSTGELADHVGNGLAEPLNPYLLLVVFQSPVIIKRFKRTSNSDLDRRNCPVVGDQLST